MAITDKPLPLMVRAIHIIHMEHGHPHTPALDLLVNVRHHRHTDQSAHAIALHLSRIHFNPTTHGSNGVTTMAIRAVHNNNLQHNNHKHNHNLPLQCHLSHPHHHSVDRIFQHTCSMARSFHQKIEQATNGRIIKHLPELLHLGAISAHKLAATLLHIHFGLFRHIHVLSHPTTHQNRINPFTSHFHLHDLHQHNSHLTGTGNLSGRAPLGSGKTASTLPQAFPSKISPE